MPLFARLCHVLDDARTSGVAPPGDAELRRAREAMEDGRAEAARGGG